jgi:protocatechuate 3,4-dioxygenase, beta subunit
MKALQLTLITLLLSCYPMQAPKVAEKTAPAKVTVAAKSEPGERLIVTGKVTDAAGKPVAGASVYVYHTDNRGYYSSEVNDDNRNPRLRGYMRTDGQGRYEYDTIKPAHYPNNRIPAHIHYVVNAEGYRERIFEIVFTGDEFITDQIRTDATREDSGFSIRPLERDKQGILHCTQDVILKK